MSEEIPIKLNDIVNGCAGITPAMGNFLLESCVVTLANSNHETGVKVFIHNKLKDYFIFHWDYEINDQTLRTWKDQDIATEHAAECIAVLVAKSVTGYSVIERSVKTTGFDYWLGTSEGILFDKKARLEVSGIFRGDDKLVTKRVKKKIEQMNQSANIGLPAHVSVTEFSKPMTYFD